jgi:ribulose bisphosphate carboxylase small subunit
LTPFTKGKWKSKKKIERKQKEEALALLNANVTLQPFYEKA